MGQCDACVKTVRVGDKYYLFDAKDPTLEALTVLEAATYAKRYAEARKSGDPTVMFDSPDQYATLSEGELEAYKIYLSHESGPLGDLHHGETVVAYEAEVNRTFRPEPVGVQA